MSESRVLDQSVWPETDTPVEQGKPDRLFRAGHPAQFSAAILDKMLARLRTEVARKGRAVKVLDPFGGVGGIHKVSCETIRTVSIEIEATWAIEAEATYPHHLYPFATSIQGDSIRWAEEAATCLVYDVLATSPVYPNGMADNYVGVGKTPRNTYASHLGELPAEGSSAGLGRWSSVSGRNKHMGFNERAFDAFANVLAPGALLLINTKDPTWTDSGVRQIGPFSAAMWQMFTERHGAILEGLDVIPTRGRPSGKYSDQRTGCEYVAAYRMP